MHMKAMLEELAYNLYWAWHDDVRDLFARLSPARWRETHNPVAVLRAVDVEEVPSSLRGYCSQVYEDFRTYVDAAPSRPEVAYFCMEFGIDAVLPFYAGGLGVLAGDILKAASDAALPLVGVGLLYHGPLGCVENLSVLEGMLPLKRCDGISPMRIVTGAGEMWFDTWCADVGRSRVYLLSSCVENNPPSMRAVTERLYPDDKHVRLLQEVLLGVGGVKVFESLGVLPRCFHLNEGKSAFCLVPLRARGDARPRVVFTLHTPVSAALERFEASSVVKVLRPLLDEYGWDEEEFLRAGCAGDAGTFDMSAFGLRLADACNAVSRVHAEVSRGMWGDVAPDGISSVRNGVHVPTWLGPEVRDVLEAYLGDDWMESAADPDALEEVPAEALWEAHRLQKRRMLRVLVEGRLGSAFGLDAEALTVVWARRFTGYKRPLLVWEEMERFLSLLSDDARPVQFVFAGAAHPADAEGCGAVERVKDLMHDPRARGRVVYVPGYDIAAARLLVAGADVWLATPVPGMEASGTSGQKAALNGALNLGVADGWWAEVYDGKNGWVFGEASRARDGAAAARSLFDVLGGEVVPLYYDRGEGIPVGWAAMMKRSIASAFRECTARRMVKEYTRLYRMPLHAVQGR